MTSPIEKIPQICSFSSKAQFLNRRPDMNYTHLRRKIFYPHPKEFLAKSLKKGRIINKARDLALSYLRYRKPPPLRCDVSRATVTICPPSQRHFLTCEARQDKWAGALRFLKEWGDEVT
jgi:hypothetical protein